MATGCIHKMQHRTATATILQLAIIAIALTAASVSAFDLLQQYSTDSYCKRQPDGQICDLEGLSICNKSRCVSICASLGMEQCLCPSEPTAEGRCSFCCGNFKTKCYQAVEWTNVFKEPPPYLKEARPEFCPRQCSTPLHNGRLCNLSTSPATESTIPARAIYGVCSFGTCSDPCKLISSSMELCQSDGVCAPSSGNFCCRGGANQACRAQSITQAKLLVEKLHWLEDKVAEELSSAVREKRDAGGRISTGVSSALITLLATSGALIWTRAGLDLV